MCIRFASCCRSRAARLARASMLAGSFSFLLPVIPALSPDAAAAQVTAVAAHPYASHVAEAAQRFGIPKTWIWAVMRAESNGDPGAVSRVGAMGLMQLMPGTWAGLTARYGLGDNPWDARANIHAGAAYLREMVERYGDLPSALAAYNAGPGRVDDWRARGRALPAETIAYVAKIAPMVGASGGTAPADLPGVSRALIAPVPPSWRNATLFVLRGDSGSGDGNAAPATTVTTPVVQAARTNGAVSAVPGAGPSRPSVSSARGLFASVSAGREQ